MITRAFARSCSRTTLLAVGAWWCVACGDGEFGDSAAVAAPNLAVRVVSGDRQLAADGERLSAPIVAEARALDGTPIANASVTWLVNDGGTITATTSRTDANGRAEATWTLGINEEHEGSVRVAGLVAAPFSASEPPTPVLELRDVALLRPRTFEGSRQTVHPDFVRTPDDWNAYTLHLALTPYPNSNTKGENPSLYVSRGGHRWFPEAGLTNPVTMPSAGYLSDPDLVYVPDRRELWMYYRQADSKNRIFLVRSTDGITFGAPEQVVEAPNHTVISPAVVRVSSRNWYMWSVNSNDGGCNGANAFAEVRHSRDGIHWGNASPVDLRGDVRMPWHIEVQYIPELKQFWALYPVKRPYTCATQALYLATSTDGEHWTNYPRPLLEAGELPELSDIVYRSTFEYSAVDDEFRFWFSGAVGLGGFDFDWRTVHQRRSRADVLGRVSGALASPMASRVVPVAPRLLTPP